MKCLQPIELVNRPTDRGTKQPEYYKNGKQAEPQRGLLVACRRCPNCIISHRLEWTFRMEIESKQCTSAFFVTLTYEDPPETVEGLYTLDKRDFQLFMKRQRKIHNPQRGKLKYYMCGEYGTETRRPHYHAVIFNICEDNLFEDWAVNHGHVQIDIANSARMGYLTKYMDKYNNQTNEDLNHLRGLLPEYRAMSREIGDAFLTPEVISRIKNGTLDYVTTNSGIKLSVPQYYLKKVLDNHQGYQKARKTREKLANPIKLETPLYLTQSKHARIRKFKKNIKDDQI